MTITTVVYISLLNNPVERPSSAKIRPTSPRGTIDIPIASFIATFSLINSAPPIFDKIATAVNEMEKYQKKCDVQSILLRSRDKPTATKNIGVNS